MQGENFNETGKAGIVHHLLVVLPAKGVVPLDVLAHAVKQDLAATIREGAGNHPVPALGHVLRQLHPLNPLLTVHDAAGHGRL